MTDFACEQKMMRYRLRTLMILMAAAPLWIIGSVAFFVIAVWLGSRS
jgi:hypothetical protein